MTWGSAGAFFAMGGYAVYVWGAYGVTAVAIATELWLLGQRRRTLLLRLGRSGSGRARPGPQQGAQ